MFTSAVHVCSITEYDIESLKFEMTYGTISTLVVRLCRKSDLLLLILKLLKRKERTHKLISLKY